MKEPVTGEQIRRGVLLDAYYEQLNAWPDFVERLRRLEEQIGHATRAPDLFSPPAHDQTGPRPVSGLPDVVMPPIWAFIQANGLPADRWLDVLFAVREPTTPITIKWAGGGDAVPEEGTVSPYLAAPFPFDPTLESGAALRAHAIEEGRRVMQSIIDQGRSIDASFKDAGWRPVATRYRSDDELRRLAKRLYRRVVLRWTCKLIASTETDEGVAAVMEDAVRKSTTELAKLLGVTPPEPEL